MKPDLKKKEITRVATTAEEKDLFLSHVNRLEANTQVTLLPQGIPAIFFFLILCAVGNLCVQYQTAVPHEIRAFLGVNPPVFLINIAMTVYFSCAIIQILPRALNANFCYKGWAHITYLAGFYLFYFFAQALETTLPAILATGAALLIFEYIALQIHNRRSLFEN